MVTAWIAAHTGLPSFHLTGPVTLRSGARVIAQLAAGQAVLVSDALAVPGAETEYTIGGETVTLARSAGVDPSAVLTDAAGRGVPSLRRYDNADPVSWQSDVTRFNAHLARWPIEDPAAQGTSELVLTDPARERELWSILRRHAAVIIAPHRPMPGVPMRCVTVDSVRRAIFSPDGWLNFEVAWTEAPGVSGAAPVVTWGEWDGFESGWQPWSALEVAQRVAGMPA